MALVGATPAGSRPRAARRPSTCQRSLIIIELCWTVVLGIRGDRPPAVWRPYGSVRTVRMVVGPSREAAMNTARITVPGTIRPDGSLDLEASVALPPGPVRVTMSRSDPRDRAERHGHGLLEALEAIHASQLARGFLGRPAEEWEKDRERSGVEDQQDEEAWRAIWSRTVSGRPTTGGSVADALDTLTCRGTRDCKAAPLPLRVDCQGSITPSSLGLRYCR